ncbi:hypothetical protein JKF63_05949 [Porcisia hertigi]|uniref:Uncharacterized protein n=1 Tax=Porcisia hertigi TaxID=2761500 RepID=A0A836I867_9TRYP|nr:hypothetical protein JKF63_05949 [Porcisia hertigi]
MSSSAGATPTTPPAPTPPVAVEDAPMDAPHFRRVAALTYRTAPSPSDGTNDIFEAVLMLAENQLDPDAEVMRENKGGSSASRLEKATWLGRAWRHVVNYTSKNLAQTRQADFLNAFSRQLELNPAEESSTVMVSCQCSIVSGGELRLGSLFATNCGLYFCSRIPEVEPPADTATKSDANANRPKDKGSAQDEPDYIKERVLFTDVASLLPSIFLNQNGTTTPFIQGIPNGVVAPTALQVFTVRLSMVLQFVDLHTVAVKRPEKSAPETVKSRSDTMQDAPCTDVVRKREFNLIGELPPKLDTLKFCALLSRLWARRLHELGRPLENPTTQYADPH